MCRNIPFSLVICQNVELIGGFVANALMRLKYFLIDNRPTAGAYLDVVVGGNLGTELKSPLRYFEILLRKDVRTVMA